MREKLELLTAKDLKELAKSKGLSIAGKKKNEIIDILIEQNEKEKKNW